MLPDAVGYDLLLRMYARGLAHGGPYLEAVRTLRGAPTQAAIDVDCKIETVQAWCDDELERPL